MKTIFPTHYHFKNNFPVQIYSVFLYNINIILLFKYINKLTTRDLAFRIIIFATNLISIFEILQNLDFRHIQID